MLIFRKFGRRETDDFDRITGTFKHGKYLITKSNEELLSTDEIFNPNEAPDIFFWNGPDETDRYIVAEPTPGTAEEGQPTQSTGIYAKFGFFASVEKTEDSFVGLVNAISKIEFTKGVDAKQWLYDNGYWTTYDRWLDIVYSTSAGRSYGLDPNGQVWAWGNQYNGELGNGFTTGTYTSPIKVSGTTTFTKIYQSSGIDQDGQIWTWGDNSYGQLGIDEPIVYGNCKCTPVSIDGVRKTFCEISNGTYVLAIDYTGQVWSWGNNSSYQLGVQTPSCICTPVSLSGYKKTFCKISGYGNKSYGIDYEGQVWCWGKNGIDNFGGNLGIDNSGSTECYSSPISLGGVKKTFCDIKSGGNHTISLDQYGQIWSWGNQTYGMLGNNTSTDKAFTPVSICGTKKTFCHITIGDNYSNGIDYKGQVWSWGYNYYSTLGDGTQTSQMTPISLGGTKKTFCSIDTRYKHIIAIDNYGQGWGWGDNSSGELGRYYDIFFNKPICIQGTKKTFCDIAGQGNHFGALDYTGQIWHWGLNNQGQFGRTGNTDGSPLSVWGVRKTFKNVQVGSGNHSSGLDQYGQVWCWGSGNSGILGNGLTSNAYSPVSIIGTKKTFCKISKGSYFSNGIDQYGQAWSWGAGYGGRLGDGSTSNRCTPVSVTGTKKTFCEISSGGDRTLVIDQYGQVWGWGINSYGRIGDNTLTSRRTPVSIVGDKKTFCKIYGGSNNHSLGIDQYGQVWCWGDNTNGELGDGTTTSRRTPVSLTGTKKTFCEITAYQDYSLAIDYQGQVWGWGENDGGYMIGNVQERYDRYTPISLSSGNKKTFCKITTGYNTIIALEYTGQVWGWGNNQYNKVGVSYDTSTPIKIYL